MGWSTEFFREGRHKALGFDSMQAFVDTFMTGYFAPMDPNDLLAMAWKWQRGDVSRNTGDDLASALEQRLIPGSQLRPLKSICGHLGLIGVDPELLAQLDANLNELLATPVS
jgi:homoserine O-acetyltransferase/O-succinyltransferase